MSRIKWFLFLGAALLALIIVACTPNPQPKALTVVPSLAPGATLTLAQSIQGGEVATPDSGTGDPAVGVAVYMLHCTSCHGVMGEGGSGAVMRNNTFIANNTDQAIQDTIANGRPGTEMPGWLMAQGGPLTSSEIRNVAAFVRVFQKVPEMATPTPSPEEATETPPPANAPTAEPAQPSNTGGPGAALTLTGNADRGQPLFGQYCASCHGPQGTLGTANPGTDDGYVPQLNPIDPSIANADPVKFANNVDLFVEHGSVPGGDQPKILMPNFGDAKILTPQQIADLLAYVVRINTAK
jgi:mono/diheme cytochrome c family protein